MMNLYECVKKNVIWWDFWEIFKDVSFEEVIFLSFFKKYFVSINFWKIYE